MSRSQTATPAAGGREEESSAVALVARYYNSLSEGHKRLADFILASPHEAALMTQEQISEATGVSKATANRLGKKLGLEGYPELQAMLRAELRQALRPVEDFTEMLNLQHLSRSAPWTQSMREDLERICRMEPIGGDGAFARACSLLTRARQVYFAGLGSSAFIVQYAAFCFSTLRGGGEAVVDSSGFEGAERKILDADAKDAALLVGFARYSDPVLRLARQMHKAGVPIICITDAESSPFRPLAAECFLVERKTGFMLTGSGAGAVSVIEALLRGVAVNLGEKAVSRRSARLTSMLGDAVIVPESGDI